MDHFAIIDKWHKEVDGNKRILRPPYPWYSSTLNDFDVTLTTELIDDAEIDDVLDKQSQFVIDKQMEDHEWLEQPVTTTDCQHFFVGEDNKWVLLFGIFLNSPQMGNLRMHICHTKHSLYVMKMHKSSRIGFQRKTSMEEICQLLHKALPFVSLNILGCCIISVRNIKIGPMYQLATVTVHAV